MKWLVKERQPLLLVTGTIEQYFGPFMRIMMLTRSTFPNYRTIVYILKL